MSKFATFAPQLSVRLYKSISRETIDGNKAVSARYKGKSEYIDLTEFLGTGSSVRTRKSVREPAGGFTLTFADRPQNSLSVGSALALETVYGLIEPMDVVEIRMWSGSGVKPAELPIIMRGFVSDIQRTQVMTDNNTPQRFVTVSGQDYGKIWQMYQIIYLAAYAAGKSLLTNFKMFELFGVKAVTSMPAAEFVKTMIEKVINKHIKEFMPENGPMPKAMKEIKTSDIAVKHGVVNNSYQQMQGSIYEILRFHGDIGFWNELYTEDREDGVYCVYRPIPALHLSKPKGKDSRLIQDDAPKPIYVNIDDSLVKSVSASRSDSSVANFFWVNNSKYDMISDMQRKLNSIPSDDGKVSLKDYPNASVKYYGVRPMYAETQQGDDGMTYVGPGQKEPDHNKQVEQQEAWIDKRRQLLMEMNRDNVVFESGSIVTKGGPMRPDGKEAMKAGDYVSLNAGRLSWDAYVFEIQHDFQPLQSYTTTLMYDRGEGFAVRTSLDGGVFSPWLYEQATRGIITNA